MAAALPPLLPFERLLRCFNHTGRRLFLLVRRRDPGHGSSGKGCGRCVLVYTGVCLPPRSVTAWVTLDPGLQDHCLAAPLVGTSEREAWLAGLREDGRLGSVSPITQACLLGPQKGAPTAMVVLVPVLWCPLPEQTTTVHLTENHLRDALPEAPTDPSWWDLGGGLLAGQRRPRLIPLTAADGCACDSCPAECPSFYFVPGGPRRRAAVHCRPVTSSLTREVSSSSGGRACTAPVRPRAWSHASAPVAPP